MTTVMAEMDLNTMIHNRKFVSAVLCLFLILGLTGGCDRRPQDAGDESLPESFRFMEIGVNTVVDADVLSKLNRTLGSEAVDRSSPISLEIKYKGFLKRYYPELAALDQQLNLNDVVRKEYPVTKLTFRYPQQGQSIFDYVELIHMNRSGHPLVIKTVAKREIPDLIQEVTEKFGTPQQISLADGEGTSLIWRQHQDAFIITRFAGRYGKPENYIMIVFTTRLRQLLQQEAEKSQQQKKQGGGSVFQ